MMQSFLTQDGTRLAYRDQGEGLPLLALAGLTRDGRDFDPVVPHLPPLRLLRLDSRGRGGSQWSDPARYTVPQEAADVLAFLDHLGLEKVAILGTSRGGLIALALAALAPGRLLGLCFNDIGPALAPEGLARIAAGVGRMPRVESLDALALALPDLRPGFAGVSAGRWREEAGRMCQETPEGLRLSYDPALAAGFAAALGAPLPDLWPLFDACAGLPLAALRGANSDLFSAETLAEMARRRPDLIAATIPGRGHVPFLDEPEALAALRAWLRALGPA